jgi:hypothetical protein
MKTFLLAIILASVLVFPAGAAAKPDQSDKRDAIAQCKAERGKTKATREAFRAKYHGFSRCVRQNEQEEAAEEDAALKNAAKQCKAEREEIGATAFAERYGTNSNQRNAHGKCVSGKAHELEAAMDAEDAQEVAEFKNAAKECAAERNEIGTDAFADLYGTNPNKRNAFGKCVSSKADDGDEDES